MWVWARLNPVPSNIVEVKVLVDVQAAVLPEQLGKVHDPGVQLHHLSWLRLHDHCLIPDGGPHSQSHMLQPHVTLFASLDHEWPSKKCVFLHVYLYIYVRIVTIAITHSTAETVVVDGPFT